jgi:hypothetical protein
MLHKQLRLNTMTISRLKLARKKSEQQTAVREQQTMMNL